MCLASVIWTGCEDEYVYNSRMVSGIELVGTKEDGNLLFSKGESSNVQVKILPIDAINKNEYSFSYESSDESVFMVNSTGDITGIKQGEAELIVKAINNPTISKKCKVTVQPNWIRTIELPQEYRDCKLLVNGILNLEKVVTVIPDNADNKALSYISSNPDIVTVTSKGVVTGISQGEVEIVIQATDGGGAMTSIFIEVIEDLLGDFPRNAWEVTASHPYVPDSKGGGGAPECILDGSYNTFLSIRKPGKGDETPEGASIFFTIDLRQSYPFNYFQWHHRGDNSQGGLRASEVTVYGSLNGENFELIKGNIALDTSVDGITGEKIDLEAIFTYRYVRFLITGYDTKKASAVQVSEIQIGREQE